MLSNAYFYFVRCRQRTRIILLLIVTFCLTSLLYQHVNNELPYSCPGCKVYNLNRNISHKYDCIPTRYKPPIVLCIYSIDEDIRISYNLKMSGTWELTIVETFQKWLTDRPRIGVIDIGANIGLYSLLSLAMGHRTVAVDPNIRSLSRLRASVLANGLDPDHVTTLLNAVGDKRGPVNVIRSKDNQGDTRVSEARIGWIMRDPVNMIAMDDIITFCPFSDAIMKIDIQGYEHKAFARAGRLFDVIKIHYVIMEMREILFMTRTHNPRSRDIRLIEGMLEFFRNRRYAPRDISGAALNDNNWRQWPDDVIWLHDVTGGDVWF